MRSIDVIREYDGKSGSELSGKILSGTSKGFVLVDFSSVFSGSTGSPGPPGPPGPAGTITQVTGVTVLVTGWTASSGIFEYDIVDSNISATSIVDVIPANADYTTVVAAQLLPENISSAGEVKIFAVNTPSTDFDVTLNIFD